MQILSQRDPKWGNINLGTSNTFIKDNGCTITCIAMIIGTTPDVVNNRMNAVAGFANGNLVIWAKIAEAFPGITVRRVWTYDNTDVLANVPNVLVEVDATPIGGTGKHWVVYIGNKRLYDPWTGTERPTSDFPGQSGYCVLTGTWTNTTPTDTYKGYDLTNKDSMKVAVDVLVRLQAGEFIDKIKYDADIKAKDDTIANLNTQIQKAQTDAGVKDGEIGNLKTQLLNETAAKDLALNQAKDAIQTATEYHELKKRYDSDKIAWNAEASKNQQRITSLENQLIAKTPKTFIDKILFLFNKN